MKEREGRKGAGRTSEGGGGARGSCIQNERTVGGHLLGTFG